MEKAKQLIAFAQFSKFWEDWDAAYNAACEAWDNATTVKERNALALLIVQTEKGFAETTTPAALRNSAFNRPSFADFAESMRGAA